MLPDVGEEQYGGGQRRLQEGSGGYSMWPVTKGSTVMRITVWSSF